MSDQTLTCRDCGQSFVFTTGEQEFYASRGFDNTPSRCASCRSARKAERGEGGGGSYGGGSSYGGGAAGGGYQRREREMFDAVCGQCGKDTQVPFQPRGDRPVYCSDCFEQQRSKPAAGGRGGRW